MAYARKRPSQSVKKYLMIAFWLILLQVKSEQNQLIQIILLKP
jgi:hypothetical protein